jgi:hypothetical protein
MQGWTTSGHPGRDDAPSRESGTPRYELEMESCEQGWQDPALVYDKEKDLFRFTDGRFIFSRDHADWELLRKRDE